MNSSVVKNKEAGFSIIELMIALSAMLIVTASAIMLMKDSIKVSNTTFELTDAQESLRSAQEYISRDLVVAGDGLRGINNIVLPIGFVTNYLTATPVTDINTPGYVNLSILTSDDTVPAATVVRNTAPAVTVRSTPTQTDRLTMLVADRNFTSIALPANATAANGLSIAVAPADLNKFTAGEIYFITSEVGATFGTITGFGGTAARPTLIFAAGDTYGMNVPVNGGPISNVSVKGTVPTSLSRMQIVHYFVNSDGLLIRRNFGIVGAGFRDSVIAEHVTNLQFRYVLSLEDDNGFVQQPVRRLSTPEEQISVRQVEVTLATETVHYVNTQTVNGMPRGSRQEITMTTSTSVRNLQFREALQPTNDN